MTGHSLEPFVSGRDMPEAGPDAIDLKVNDYGCLRRATDSVTELPICA